MNLDPCPNSPNCVSTQAAPTDDEHRMEPVAFSGSVEDAKAAIMAVLGETPRTTVVEEQAAYVKAVCTTRIMRFKDDVEFLVDPAGQIHFRSASRVGQSDLGANRKRMTDMSERLAARLG